MVKEEDIMKRWNRNSWLAAAGAVTILAACGIARAQESPQTLVYAVYDSENGAKDAFNAMKQSQKEGVIHIDSFAVISKDAKGKVHVQSTQKRGAKAGAVIGALIGVLGGPVGAAVGAGAGGGLGYLTGEAVGIPQEDINAIKSSLQPSTSAVVAVVDERWVADLERSLNEAQAKQVLDHKIAAPEAGKQEGQSPSTKPQKSDQINP
jgi:uncharacterized membrane protein